MLHGDMAMQAMIAIGHASETYLIKALNSQGRKKKRSIIALGEIGSTKAVEPLIELLKEGDKRTRRLATEALGDIGSRGLPRRSWRP